MWESDSGNHVSYVCFDRLSAWFSFLLWDGKGAKGDLRCGGTQTEASGASRNDSDLAFKGEQGREIVELCFGHCERRIWRMRYGWNRW